MENSKTLATRLNQLEQTILNRLQQIEATLQNGKNTFTFFNNALNCHTDITLQDLTKNAPDNPVNIWHEKIRNDPEIRHPHRKIMETLINEYDYLKKQFKPIHFSKIVKESKVGKNKAGEYLDLLSKKGFILKEETGYRTFYKIRG